MKTSLILSLILVTTTIVGRGQTPASETNSPQITQATDPLLQTWAVISNHWELVPPTKIKTAAEQGDLSAQFFLGMEYFNGIQLVQDQDEAIKWIKSAANQGLAAAQHNMGWRYNNGNGVKKDKSQAVAWYPKAADRGFVKSQINLGWLYAEWDPVDQPDYELAEKWGRKAAEQGSAEAQYQFGRLLTQEFDKEGHQVANFQLASEWYRKAADQGYAKAQFELAGLYNEGKLGDDQRSNCIPWYLKAAANGNPEAQAEVGSLREFYPHSPLLNSVNPVQLLQQSAEQGNVNAQFELAQRYRTGGGVPKDLREALRWMQKAARNYEARSSVSSDATFQLARMYDNGEGVAQDSAKAFQLYKQIVDGGSLTRPDIQFRLGQMFEGGQGVAQNDLLAASNYYAATRFGPAIFEATPIYGNSSNGESLHLTTNSLGSQAAERLLNLYINGRGLAANPSVSEQLIQLKATATTLRGGFLFGEILYEGKIVKKDLAQAAELFGRAAEQGSPEAMNRIGDMWAGGMNGAPDPNEAAKWYQRAADKGFAEAQYNIGLGCAKGEGVPANPVEAWKWLQLAAEQKFPNATEERDKIQATMTKEQVNDARDRANSATR